MEIKLTKRRTSENTSKEEREIPESRNAQKQYSYPLGGDLRREKLIAFALLYHFFF